MSHRSIKLRIRRTWYKVYRTVRLVISLWIFNFISIVDSMNILTLISRLWWENTLQNYYEISTYPSWLLKPDTRTFQLRLINLNHLRTLSISVVTLKRGEKKSFVTLYFCHVIWFQFDTDLHVLLCLFVFERRRKKWSNIDWLSDYMKSWNWNTILQ